jgi:gamma-glutamyltranspeptidase/glutathione hydrolase/leukotriene-C4 hydrolase
LSFKLKGGLNLHTPPPPGSGAIVGGILKILDHFELDSSAKENEIIYKFLEASKFAFAQR